MNLANHPYEAGIDFLELALAYPYLKHLVSSKGRLDFKDPEAARRLTQALLDRDFGRIIKLPEDRLCPPVPNRLGYILWVQKILDTTGLQNSDEYEPERKVVGLDIGTGASCIYPLLGTALRTGWNFLGTEIDEKSLEYARENVAINGLGDRIEILETSDSDSLIPLDKISAKQIDFTMCNPPFYSSFAELEQSAALKSKPPSSINTGSENELITPGGELAFIRSHLEDSKRLKRFCQWYTTLVGHLTTLHQIVPLLADSGVTNYAIASLISGSQTRRWGLAWSFEDRRPRDSVARACDRVPKALLPSRTETEFSIKQGAKEVVKDAIKAFAKYANISWDKNEATMFVWGDCWSRKARRARERGVVGETQAADNLESAKLGMRANFADDGIDCKVKLRWLKGDDRILWESFCGWIQRQAQGGGIVE